MMEAFLNSTAYQALAVIVSIISATSVIVWKLSQAVNKITNTQQAHTDAIAEVKKTVAEISKVQTIHNTALIKAQMIH